MGRGESGNWMEWVWTKSLAKNPAKSREPKAQRLDRWQGQFIWRACRRRQQIRVPNDAKLVSSVFWISGFLDFWLLASSLG